MKTVIEYILPYKSNEVDRLRDAKPTLMADSRLRKRVALSSPYLHSSEHIGRVWDHARMPFPQVLMQRTGQKIGMSLCYL